MPPALLSVACHWKQCYLLGGGGRERPVQRQHERRKSRCVEVKARNLAVGASKGRDMVDAIKKGKVDIVFGQK